VELDWYFSKRAGLLQGTHWENCAGKALGKVGREASRPLPCV
jgi:hypothetical protein